MEMYSSCCAIDIVAVRPDVALVVCLHVVLLARCCLRVSVAFDVASSCLSGVAAAVSKRCLAVAVASVVAPDAKHCQRVADVALVAAAYVATADVAAAVSRHCLPVGAAALPFHNNAYCRVHCSPVAAVTWACC